MTTIEKIPPTANNISPCRWHDWPKASWPAGLRRQEGLDILHSGDEELLDLLAAAYRVRHRWFGNRVHLNFLINAKCGGCSEDCGYCSQSKVSRADIAPYGLVDAEEILAGGGPPLTARPRPIASSPPVATRATRTSIRSSAPSPASRPTMP